ncbi:RNA polymerase sigma factor [Kolteria novifilia]|uniref:RNA polymerase sigma factor n=1 Tax=Kolteria novifilia TaxID=2527975 RepID=UPI003AF38648
MVATTSTVAEILERARQGDEHAAYELVRRYEPLIRRAIRVRLVDRHLLRLVDPSDIVQSVFQSFFQRLVAGEKEFDDSEKLVRYLIGMTRNRVASEVRSHRRDRRDYRRTISLHDENNVASERIITHRSPSEEVVTTELMGRVKRTLSPREHELITMRTEGHSWSEIADRLGGSHEALRKQFTRVLKRVRGDLQVAVGAAT